VNNQAIDLYGELPILTEMADGPALDDLPILTEVVSEKAQPGDSQPVFVQELIPSESALPRTLNTEEMQRLLQQLETHLEIVFTSKLNGQLEQLQKLAVDLAVSEFKAELPQLLRDALIQK